MTPIATKHQLTPSTPHMPPTATKHQLPPSTPAYATNCGSTMPSGSTCNSSSCGYGYSGHPSGSLSFTNGVITGAFDGCTAMVLTPVVVVAVTYALPSPAGYVVSCATTMPSGSTCGATACASGYIGSPSGSLTCNNGIVTGELIGCSVPNTFPPEHTGVRRKLRVDDDIRFVVRHQRVCNRLHWHPERHTDLIQWRHHRCVQRLRVTNTLLLPSCDSRLHRQLPRHHAVRQHLQRRGVCCRVHRHADRCRLLRCQRCHLRQ